MAIHTGVIAIVEFIVIMALIQLSI